MFRPPDAVRLNPWRRSYEGGACLVPELKMVGWDRFPRAQAVLGPHAHAGVYEVCYLVAGAVDWWAGDGADVAEVGPGDVYVTRPGEPHGGEAAFMHPCELYWVQVAVPLPSDTLPPADAGAIAAGLAGLSPRAFAGDAAIGACCQQILAEHDRPGRLARVAVRAALHELLVLTLRCHERAARAPSSAASPAVRTAARWIADHLADDFTVAELAARARLGASRFHDRFAAETGFTPGAYRTRLRVRAAKRLLRGSDRPVTDLALDLGFRTSQYFATVFKAQTGLTPLAYRRLARGGGSGFRPGPPIAKTPP